MKRSPALAPLSRDHHAGLFAAQQLKRADPATAAAARERFLSFWQQEGSKHFRIEEEVLLPGFARYESPDHEAVVRVLVDHVALRRMAADLEAEAEPALDRLHELGERLEGHIRHEERVLFPAIEQAMPEPELAELGEAVARAEGKHGP